VQHLDGDRAAVRLEAAIEMVCLSDLQRTVRSERSSVANQLSKVSSSSWNAVPPWMRNTT